MNNCRPSSGCVRWIKRALVGLLLYLLGFGKVALAQYHFLTGDPRSAQEKLITDLQRGKADERSLTTSAQTTLRSLSDNSGHIPAIDQLGELRSVCPILILRFPKGANLSFRTTHENGSMDWVVTVSRTPEMVENLAFFRSKDSGPPAILPPYIPGGETKLLPSVQIDCAKETDRPASNEELIAACEKWPDMCR